MKIHLHTGRQTQQTMTRKLNIYKTCNDMAVGELPKDRAVVDPLSLYLSVKASRDERIEMALDQILAKFIW